MTKRWKERVGRGRKGTNFSKNVEKSGLLYTFSEAENGTATTGKTLAVTQSNPAVSLLNKGLKRTENGTKILVFHSSTIHKMAKRGKQLNCPLTKHRRCAHITECLQPLIQTHATAGRSTNTLPK